MNPLGFALLALQLTSAAPKDSTAAVRTQQADEWVAEDKLKHLMMSAAVVGFAHAGARTATDAGSAVAVAALTGVAAGIWKELRDHRIGRPFSGRDLIWDALGIGLGVALVSKAR